jgi:hypothetical protein
VDRISSWVLSRTMFSVPLAHPSTLDRWPLTTQNLQWSASYVEELRSPILGVGVEIRQAKAAANFRRVFLAPAEAFLSQAGPRFVLKLVQAEHHLFDLFRH